MHRATGPLTVRPVLRVSLFLLLLMLVSLPSRAAQKVVLQLPWTHQFEFAGFYAAKEKGFYAHEGLDVEIRSGGVGKSSLEEVLGNKADFGVASSEIVLARTSGQPVVAMGVIFQHSASGILTLDDSGIYTPQDIIGKRIEIGDLFTDAETHAMLQSEGVTSRHYEHVPSTFSIQKLVQKDVSAASAYITNQPFYLEQQGTPYHLILPRNYGIDFYGSTLFTRENLIKDNPELAAAFYRATLRGWRYAFDRPDELIDIILQQYSNFPFAHSREHLKFEYREMKELVLPDLVEIGYMSMRRWQHMANTFVSLGLVPPDYSLEGFMWNPEEKPTFSASLMQLTLIGLSSLIVMGSLLLVYNRRLQKHAKEKQQLAEKNTHTNQKYELALWAGKTGYWCWNRSENTLYLDEEAGKLLGGHHESQRFNLQEVSSEDVTLTVRQFFSCFAEQLRKKQGRFEVMAETKRIDNEQVWLTCRGEVRQYLSDGSPDISHGFLLDTTDLHRAQRQVEQLTITDPMTGALNRRYFISRLTAYLQRVKFGEGHFSIILIDIDKMETLNSEYGAHTGDHVIESLSDIIHQQVRPMDLVARFSGKSFVLLLPNISTEDAILVGDRIRKHIAHHRFDTGHQSFFASVTVSLAHTQEFSSAELNSKHLLHIAEERVKLGKRKGRNILISRHSVNTEIK